jgi:hypothetical protein
MMTDYTGNRVALFRIKYKICRFMVSIGTWFYVWVDNSKGRYMNKIPFITFENFNSYKGNPGEKGIFKILKILTTYQAIKGIHYMFHLFKI